MAQKACATHFLSHQMVVYPLASIEGNVTVLSSMTAQHSITTQPHWLCFQWAFEKEAGFSLELCQY